MPVLSRVVKPRLDIEAGGLEPPVSSTATRASERDPLFAAEDQLLSRDWRKRRVAHDDGFDSANAKAHRRTASKVERCLVQSLILFTVASVTVMGTTFLLLDDAAIIREHAEFFPPDLVESVLGEATADRISVLSADLVREEQKEREQRTRIEDLSRALERERAFVEPRAIANAREKQKWEDDKVLNALETEHHALEAELREGAGGANAAEIQEKAHHAREDQLEAELAKERAAALEVAQSMVVQQGKMQHTLKYSAKLMQMHEDLQDELKTEKANEEELRQRLAAVQEHAKEASTDAELAAKLTAALRDNGIVQRSNGAWASPEADDEAAAQALLRKAMSQVTNSERDAMIDALSKLPHGPSVGVLQGLDNAELIFRHDHAIAHQAEQLRKENAALVAKAKSGGGGAGDGAKLLAKVRAKNAMDRIEWETAKKMLQQELLVAKRDTLKGGGKADVEDSAAAWETERHELMMLAEHLKEAKERLAMKLAARG